MKTLMVVDLQNGFMNRDCYIELKDKISALIKNVQYDKIIFTKFVNKPGSMYEKHLNWRRLQSAEEQEIAIKIDKDFEIFEKHGYGLEAEDLAKVKKWGVVDVCGLQTDACVYAIALQLFDNGIFPNILMNYVATNGLSQEDAERMLIHQFGSVDKSVY